MRGVVGVAVVFGACLPALADDMSIGAPWAGSLIVPAKAEVGVAMPASAAKASVPDTVNAKAAPDASAATPQAGGHMTIVPQVPPATASSNKKKIVLTGFASYYDFGKVTANGERFQPMGFTAAHRTLPFGTKLLVTNKKTGKSVMVRINDRGPFIRGRAIDLARGAAHAIGLDKSGLASVTMEIQ